MNFEVLAAEIQYRCQDLKAGESRKITVKPSPDEEDQQLIDYGLIRLEYPRTDRLMAKFNGSVITVARKSPTEIKDYEIVE